MLQHKNDDVIGSAIFPTPSAGSGRADVDSVTGKTDGWRCRQCGFWCSAERVQSVGTSNQGDGNIVNDASTGDPTVGRGGCPFCGSANSRG